MSLNDDASANRTLLERFYTAFKGFDADAMNACYASEIRFRDPVFERLNGDRARAMWKMLASANSRMTVECKIGKVDADEGDATWIAHYTFPATGRAVENHVRSHFWFKEGLISREEDTFDLYRWASQALGLKGRLLGWLPPVQASIRKQMQGRLDQYVARSSG